MIEQFTIKNFQSHRDNTLKFVPGVNVIIGKSDSGKSAVVRAMLWLIHNRPTGESFRSNWGGSTHVTMVTDQDNIVRMRNNTENGYRLNTQTHFNAIKTDVPEEIHKALNIGEINLQRQFAGPFLLAEETSPGEVAKHFNRVAKLDKIDDGVKNINSAVRQIEQNIKAYGMNIESSQKKLEDYAHLEEFETEVEVLELEEKAHLILVRNWGSLQALLDDLVDVGREIEDASEIMQDEELVNNTLDLIYKRDALEDGPIAGIVDLLQAIESIDVELGDWHHSLGEWEKQFEEEFPTVCPLCNTNLKAQ